MTVTAQSLPPELLSSVFLHCADVPHGALTEHNTIHTPLVLSHVCAAWRRAALATHLLWSRLFLSLRATTTTTTPSPTAQSSESTPAEDQARLAATWLVRSGALPLQIYVIWQDADPSPPSVSPWSPTFARPRSYSFSSSRLGPLTHPVLDVVQQHSHRWQSAFIYIPLEAFHSLAPIRGNLPILAELSLGTDSDALLPPFDEPDHEDLADPVVRGKLTMFEHAPALRSLECVNLDPDAFAFPWAGLTRIPIMALSIPHALAVLRRTTACLANVSFICTDACALPYPQPQPGSSPPSNGASGSNTEFSLHTPIRHPTVRELAVLTSPFSPNIDVQPLLSLLTLPRLTALRICNVHAPLSPALPALLQRCASSAAAAAHASPHAHDRLEALHLRGNSMTDGELMEVLRSASGLRKLTVIEEPLMSGRTVSGRVLAGMTACGDKGTSARDVLVPRLRDLELSIDPSLGLLLCDMLRSRWCGADPGRAGEEEESESGDEDVNETGGVSGIRFVTLRTTGGEPLDEECVRGLEELVELGIVVIHESDSS